ncbi:MAG: pyridoxal phosphate-dependent class II aminotransferase [Bacteroidales bacterium]|nr:pyridoxal phosphate-dependent class II aminotransferase [Bacteroidales bacterium]MBR5703691.1 pyridoxal phosphate-dependent class II aminotransferase [Bacteroidales bacterium]
MIQGHGDDAYRYGRPIVANFSSNVYNRVDISALKEHLRSRLDVIGSYPEPEPYTLEARIAALHGLPDPASVCVTNGATEAIYLIAQAFSGSRSAVLQPTFSEYADACRIHKHIISERSCGRDLDCELFSASKTNPGATERAMVWLCNPNNPTGGVVPKAELEALIDAHPDTVFVIDQSYGFFTREPLLTPAEAAIRPHVIQLHSMTKRYAVPGLRLGYIVAHPSLMERVREYRMPWSVNAIAIEAGLYLTEHPETAPIDLDALLAETSRLQRLLRGIPGVAVWDTSTHFMLCHLVSGSAGDMKDWLARGKGLLIRDASNFTLLGSEFFRIATQTPEENDLLVAAVRGYMEGRP